jgi:anti-anti-sigma factor
MRRQRPWQQHQPPFTYELQVSGDTTTVICHGRIVSNTAENLKQLVKPMISEVRRIVLDLSDVSYVDSAGLGYAVALIEPVSVPTSFSTCAR